MSTVIGPYIEVEAAYRRERITAEFGNPVFDHTEFSHEDSRHRRVRAISRAITHRSHRRTAA
jgi:hypothetical protein